LTLDQLHQYLTRYVEALGLLPYGAKAVGNERVPLGRDPNDIELTYTLLRLAFTIAQQR
jgi:hypothetical protein